MRLHRCCLLQLLLPQLHLEQRLLLLLHHHLPPHVDNVTPAAQS
jgi:hypothetical protein